MRKQAIKQPKIVILSGYFNPLHRGHVEMIERAYKVGTVVVIINNDEQVKLKGSVPFMDQVERQYIVKSIKGVADTWISSDEDTSVCKTLRKVVAFYRRQKVKVGKSAPHYKYKIVFANGGDRKNIADIPEAKICEELNVQMVFKMGDKIQSSSTLINNASEEHAKRKI